MKTNCPNCGAVINPEQHKCSYCGTPYSEIDFENEKPFYLKIKTKWNGKDVYITQLVKPDLNAINLTTVSNCCYGGKAEQLFSFKNENCLTTEISFTGIPMANNSLLIMEVC